MRTTTPKKETLTSTNPATLEPVGEVEMTHPQQVEEIVQKARNGFPAWRDLGLEKRTEIIKTAQQLLIERCEEFGRLITLEMGRPFVESVVLEVEAVVDSMGYYARNAQKFLSDRRLPLHNILLKRRKSRIHFQPLGVLGIISPWNWSLLIPMGCIVPALLAGNTVIHKHSELTPLVSLKIRELLLDAGVPEESFQIIQGLAPVGQALVDSSVEKIFFTGSTEVGQKIMERGARSLKKTVLELGGHDPAIVCQDADLEITGSGIVWGRFSNCGQNCNAIERVYVHETIAKDFIDLVVEKAKKLRIGNGLDPNTDMGPLASEAQREKMEAIKKYAVDTGANVLLGGHRLDDFPGYFFEPTVILWEKSIPRPIDLEIFGPILFITPVSDDEEAIQLANHSSFGLAASVWTNDANRGRRIAQRIEAGSLMINDSIIAFGIPEADWTGIKNSGVGWVHGEKGLDEMVNIQHINYDPQCHTQNFWWFPYRGSMVRTMKAGFDFMFRRNLAKKIRSIPVLLKNYSSYFLLNRKKSEKL